METQTWGISGPRFLAIYALLLALTVLVAFVDRRRRLGAMAAATSPRNSTRTRSPSSTAASAWPR